MPKKSTPASAKSKRAPAKPKRAAAKTKRTPAKPKRAAAKPKRTPAKTKKAAAKPKRAAAKPKRTPAKPKKAAAKPKRAPAKPKRTAAKPKPAPAKPKRAAAKPKPAPKKPTVATSEFRNYVPYTPKRNEEYMNESQRAHFKDILLNWKAELMEEVDRTVTHMKDEAANFPDPADRATQEEEFSLELRTRDRERKLIKKIDGTIDRIDADDYGFCNSCGVEIGIKRLEARPTATLCIDCKTLDEIKEKQELG